ncbi:MAG: protein kinase [Planctomycetaceae bacterium]|nr:protein kinase [Planctomycetaceae bacterium]
MSSKDELDDADLFDFVDEFQRDREKGRELPLAHYLRRYPGREEAIAREFLRLTGELLAPKTPTPPTQEFAASASVKDGERHIGPYRLLRELGAGGQGAVWLAEDTRIERQVALKFMPSSFALLSADRRRRFQREAEVVSRLEHPSICPVYEAQVDHDPPYIAMRAVDGETLASAIARARTVGARSMVMTGA